MVIAHANPLTSATRATLDVKSPLTGTSIGTIPLTSAEEVNAAVERARQAQAAWGALPVKARTRLLRAFGDLLYTRHAQVIEVMRRESGKPDGGALIELLHIDSLISYYHYHAPRLLAPKNKQPLFPLIHRAKVFYKPRGVVGVISPWNYPFALPFMDAIPALLAGNAVIIKPSEITPFSAEIGVALMHEAGIPRDVIQIVHGDGSTGKALGDVVDYMAFTGSTATGRKVGLQATARLSPFSLELGGKDPALVLADADLEMAATNIIKGAFENAGQMCLSIERVYVETSVYEQFVALVEQYMPKLSVSSAAGMSVDMGSMTNDAELKRTEEHVRDAVAKGARVLFGGKRLPELGPKFYAPTVLVDVDHSMAIMRDETFGPVLPIMKVANATEAIRLANDSEYGLSASIYTRDYARAEQIALQLDCGDVSINRAEIGIATMDVPMGGQKNSGMGRRNSAEGLLKYAKAQSLVIDTMRAQKPSLSNFDAVTLMGFKVVRQLRRWFPRI